MQNNLYFSIIKSIITRIFFGGLFFLLLLNVRCTNDTQFVARIGEQQITLEEFKTAYLELIKQPNKFDSPDLREKFLDELINRKLLAEQSREDGLSQDEKFIYKLEGYKNKQLRDAHFKYVIEPQIKIDSNEVRQAYTFTQQIRKIKHLFFSAKEQADLIYRKLLNGADWNALAGQIFKDKKLSQNGGDLGWVYWDQLEYDMARTAFMTPLNSFSKPVKSNFGYHIIYVENIEKQLMISGYDAKIHFDKVKTMLRKMKGDKIAYQYITDLMQNKDIQVNPCMMVLINDKFNEIFKRAPSKYEQMNEIQLTDSEMRNVEEKYWNYRKETLAIIDGKEMSVGNFINMVNYIPYSAIRQGFKKTLDYAIRDFVITNEAKKLNLADKYKFVNLKAALYEDYLLQKKYKQKIIRNVKLTDKDMRKYCKIYNIIDVQDLNRGIRKQLLNDKIRQTLADSIAALRKNIHIEKNLELLHLYYNNMKLYSAIN